MSSRHIKPNTECFNSVLNALERGGQSERAEKILSEMEASWHANAVSYNTVIASYGREGGWERALSLLDRMDRKRREQNNDRLKANTVTYNCVLNALEKGGQVDKCLELLELMGGSSGGGGNGGPHHYANGNNSKHQGGDGSPDSYSYSICITALAKAKRSDEALDLLRRMEEGYTDSSPYNAAITALER